MSEAIKWSPEAKRAYQMLVDEYRESDTITQRLKLGSRSRVKSLQLSQNIWREIEALKNAHNGTTPKDTNE